MDDPRCTDEVPFKDATVSFAVDVSGSTAARALDAEKDFVRRVSGILSEQSRNSATVLPWYRNLCRARTLSDLDSLEPLYGTRPRALLQHERGRLVLQSSSLWFLMTDGLVSDTERRAFADCITDAGLHGTTCISVIFGDLTNGPATCNISVGVSVFALCPNCLFLFYDTASQDIVIMQTKGIFNSLLKGADNPIIGSRGGWASFPRLSLNDLSDLMIPPPKRLAKQDVQLQGPGFVNMEDLWAGRLSKDQADSILANQDSLRTIVMSAQSTGKTREFQQWAQQQQIPVRDPLWESRLDVDGAARSAFQELSLALQDSHRSADVAELQRKLRLAHQTNKRHFMTICQTDNRRAMERRGVLAAACLQSARSISQASSLNSAYSQFAPDSAAHKRLNPLVLFPEGGMPEKTKRSQDAGSSPSPYSPSDSWGRASQVSTPSGWVRLEARGSDFQSKRVKIASRPCHERLFSMGEQALQSQTQPYGALIDNPGSKPTTDPMSAKGVPLLQKAQQAQEERRQPLKPKEAAAPEQVDQEPAKPLAQQPTLQLLWTPGFRSSKVDFSGTCDICGTVDTTLALLLVRNHPTETQGSHSPHSHSHGFFPGSIEVKDTCSCEACAAYWVDCEPLGTGQLMCSFPVVSFRQNRDAYLRRCDYIFGYHDSQFSVRSFIATLLRAAGLPQTRVSNTKGPLRWMCAHFIHEALLSPESRVISGPGAPLQHDFPEEDIRRLLSDPHAAVSSLAERPLPMVITVLQAAFALEVPDDIRHKIALRRYLFLLAEGLDYQESKAQEATQRLRKILWPRSKAADPELVVVDTYPDGRVIDTSGRTPLLSLPVPESKRNGLLSEADYQVMSVVEEFHLLEEEGKDWVGCVTVLFLHALLDVLEKHTCDSIFETFNIAMTRKELAPIFSNPSAVGVDEVAAMLRSLHF